MFSKEEYYETELKPIIKELMLKCSSQEIPMYLTLAIADDNKKTKYINEMLSPGALGISVTDNQITRHTAVSQGFRVVPNALELISEEEEFDDIEYLDE